MCGSFYKLYLSSSWWPDACSTWLGLIYMLGVCVPYPVTVNNCWQNKNRASPPTVPSKKKKPPTFPPTPNKSHGGLANPPTAPSLPRTPTTARVDPLCRAVPAAAAQPEQHPHTASLSLYRFVTMVSGRSHRIWAVRTAAGGIGKEVWV
jgi:hypothetical protein